MEEEVCLFFFLLCGRGAPLVCHPPLLAPSRRQGNPSQQHQDQKVEQHPRPLFPEEPPQPSSAGLPHDHLVSLFHLIRHQHLPHLAPAREPPQVLIVDIYIRIDLAAHRLLIKYLFGIIPVDSIKFHSVLPAIRHRLLQLFSRAKGPEDKTESFLLQCFERLKSKELHLPDLRILMFDDRPVKIHGDTCIDHLIKHLLAHFLFLSSVKLVKNDEFLYFCRSYPCRGCAKTMPMKKHIPNSITLLNLLSGFFSLVLAAAGDLTTAAWLIIAASLFDFLDGFSARLLHAYSDLGKQLDSLSDLISFGVAPAFILYQMLSSAGGGATLASSFPGLSFFLLLSPALLVAGAALRLARFNIDPGQETSFSGLPTPAAGLFFASLPLVARHGFAGWQPPLDNMGFLAILALLFSLLMVSHMPLFSLKLKERTPRTVIPAVILVSFSIILFLLFFLRALFLIIILYIFIALIMYLFFKEPKPRRS